MYFVYGLHSPTYGKIYIGRTGNPGQVQDTSFNVPGSSTGTFGSGNQFRYIIIPGGAVAAKTKLFDLNDYEAVTDFFGIEP